MAIEGIRPISVSSLASQQKKSRFDHCGLLKVSRKGFEEFLLLFASCSACSQRGTCLLLRRNQVGNHPSHDATLTAYLHVPKLRISNLGYPTQDSVVPCSLDIFIGEGGQYFGFSILSHFTRHSAFIEFGNILVLEIYCLGRL